MSTDTRDLAWKIGKTKELKLEEGQFSPCDASWRGYRGRGGLRRSGQAWGRTVGALAPGARRRVGGRIALEGWASLTRALSVPVE